MADWTWTTADALTAQLWAKRWWIEAEDSTFFKSHGLIGPNEKNDIIVSFPDLEQNQGYQLTYGQIRYLQSGGGITGNGNMEGNEAVPDTYDDAITLDQKRNAIRSAGKLSDQYPSDKDAGVQVRNWATVILKQWKADTIDQDLFTALGSSPTKVIYGGDATTTASIGSGDYLTLSLISKCVAYARKATPKITGKKMMGKEGFVFVGSNDQAYDLTERDAAWAQAQREAMKAGTDNPIFHTSMGVHKGTAIHEHERVAISTNWGAGSNLNGATGLFMGVGAGAIAWAKRKIWNEKTFDYGDKVGFCIGGIWGLSKTVFNSSDNAVVAVRTFRTNN